MTDAEELPVKVDEAETEKSVAPNGDAAAVAVAAAKTNGGLPAAAVAANGSAAAHSESGPEVDGKEGSKTENGTDANGVRGEEGDDDDESDAMDADEDTDPVNNPNNGADGETPKPPGVSADGSASTSAMGALATPTKSAAAPTLPITPTSTSKVNGIGMWRSWTRSFNTPVLALMDLFDNAIDAALLVRNPNGKVEFSSDLPIQNPNDPVTAKLIYQDDDSRPRPAICVHADKFGAAGGGGNVRHGRGFMLVNSCLKSIPPLAQVLEVYRSAKDDPHSIGENGVGIKQACSNLSDLSFIIKKSGNSLGLGVLCKELQTETGCVLPSHEFPLNAGENTKDDGWEESWHEELNALAIKFPRTFAVAFAQYGDGSVDQGVDQILSHFIEITKGTANNRRWTRYEHVFCVVLHELRHGAGAMSKAIESAVSEENDDADNQRARTSALLDSLAEALPRTYLHLSVPETRLLVTVRHKTVPFQFWERRLIELTRFNVFIDKETNWWESISWQKLNAGESEEEILRLVDGQLTPSQLKEEDAADGGENGEGRRKGTGSSREQTPGATTAMRIFCGFNPENPGDKSLGHGRLFIYSRQSGRLIRQTLDARGELGLTNGGTDFSQGLTIILDDFRGTLPLNPTKQDLAFGLESHGQVHRNNVMAWLAGVAHMYWHFHKDRVGGSKAELSAHVSALLPRINQLRDAAPHALPTLSSGKFSRFASVKFRNFRERIMCNAADRMASGYVLGSDTIPLIESGEFVPMVPVSKKRGRRSKPPTPAAKGKMQARKMVSASIGRIHPDDEESDDEYEPGSGIGVRKRRRATATIPTYDENLDVHSEAFFQRFAASTSDSTTHERAIASQRAEIEKLYDTIKVLIEREKKALEKVTMLEMGFADAQIAKERAEDAAERLARERQDQRDEIERLKSALAKAKNNRAGLSSSPSGGEGDAESQAKLQKLQRKLRIIQSESESRAGQISDLKQMLQRKDDEIQNLKQELLAEE